jgi:hypothetical protein
MYNIIIAPTLCSINYMMINSQRQRPAGKEQNKNDVFLQFYIYIMTLNVSWTEYIITIELNVNAALTL